MTNVVIAVIVVATYLINVDISLLVDNNKIFNVLLLISDVKLPFSVINFTLTINSKLKHVCFNNVIIYEQQKIVDVIATLIDKYQNLFIDKETTINISKKKKCLLILSLKSKSNRLKFIY